MDEPERHRRDDDMPVVLHRLDALEKRLEQWAKDQTRGFDDVRRQISGLSFVRVDVYAADQRTADEVHATIRKDLEELEASTAKGFERLDTRVNWSWSVIGVALLGAVVAGIARAAGLS